MDWLDQLPCAVLVTDGSGGVLASNADLARLVGVPGRWAGRSINELLPPASRIFMQTHVWPLLLRESRVNEVSLQVVDARQQRLPVLLNCCLGEHAGKPAYFWALFVARERHRFEAELLAARQRADDSAQALVLEHQRQRNLIDSTHAGTWEWQVPSGQLIVSEQWASVLGWTLADLGPLSNQFRAGLGHPDEQEASRQRLRDHFAGRSPAYVAELRLRHRDGHWLWVEERGRVVSRRADGRPDWVFGILIDISARKRQQDALHRMGQLLQRTGQVAGVGGWEVDLLDDTVSWSSQMHPLHGLPADFQPTLAMAFGFFATEAQPRIRAAYQAACSTGQGWDLVLPLVRADGQQILVRSVGHAERIDGKPVRLVGALQDVSDDMAQRQLLRAARERMALAADSGGIGVWDLDLRSQQLTLDAWVVRLYQLPAGHLPAPDTLWGEAVHPDDRPGLHQAVAEASASRRTLESEFRIRWPDGSLHHLRLSARINRDDHGQATHLVGVCWDVTPLRELAAELSQQHEMLRVTLESIGDAVITTDDQGRVNWLNPVAERMTGWATAQAQGLPLAQVFNIVNEDSRQAAANPVTSCLAEGKIVGLANHTVLIARDGTEYGIEDSAAPIRNPQGRVLGVVLVFHDVSEQRRLSGEMSWRATHDALTGLVNRSECEARLLRLLRKAHDEGDEHALLYIDLDQFKRVNDACGHAVGDQLLQQMAKLLTAAVRSRDTVARLGGDEFAIVLEHCGLDQALLVAQKICDQMDDFRFVHEAQRFRIGTSIGLVPLDRRWASTAALQQAADSACFAAKEAGRNRVQVWLDTDLSMQSRQVEAQWTTRIERALDEGGFELFAQRVLPLGDAGPGLHAELLLRLRNPDNTLSLPTAFLPAAERFHLVTRLDRWVLDQALAWLQALPEPARVAHISVNLSGQSVGDRAFHAWAMQRLQAAGPAVCQCLGLEITETAAITHLADAAAFITQVRGLQVTVALDDFGAGSSSFGYLKALSVDLLKIDGQFVRDLVSDPLDAAAVRCFADVARVIGVRTVAECVEDASVLQRLREIGVDFAQGHLIHRPAPLADLLASTLALETA